MNGLVLIVATSLLGVGLVANVSLEFQIIVGIVFVVSLFIETL